MSKRSRGFNEAGYQHIIMSSYHLCHAYHVDGVYIACIRHTMYDTTYCYHMFNVFHGTYVVCDAYVIFV